MRAREVVEVGVFEGRQRVRHCGQGWFQILENENQVLKMDR